MLVLYAHSVCWLCDLHVQYGSHICSVIYTYMEIMLYTEFLLHIEFNIDNLHTYLSLYKYLDNLPMYTYVITLW